MKDYIYDYSYDKEGDLVYCYSGTNVLKNKMNIKSAEELIQFEREYLSVRYAELSDKKITGKFDFEHLRSIYK